MPPKKTKEEKQAELLKAQQELRLKAEEEERQRQETERVRLEEEARLAKEQAERLQRERGEAESWHTMVLAREHQLDLALQQEEEWQSFLRCDEKPDPLTTSQISCFVSQYEAETLKNISPPQVQSYLDSIQLAQDMVDVLRQTQAILLSNLDHPTAFNCGVFARKLKSVRKAKTDSLVQKFLLGAQSILDSLVEDEKKKQASSETVVRFRSRKYFNIAFYICQVSAKAGFKIRNAVLPELNLQFELPAKLINCANMTMACATAQHELQEGAYFAVGLVYEIQFYQLPQLGRKSSTWALNPAVQGKGIASSCRINVSTVGKQGGFGVNITLPESVVLDKEAVKVMHYENGDWTEAFQVEGPVFDPFKKHPKSIRFLNRKQGLFAVVMPKDVDYPYQSWKLRSVARGKAWLDFKTKRFSLKFQIGSGHVRLLGPDLPELRDLQQPSKPGQLLRELKSRGINLLPSDEDLQLLKINSTPHQIEEKAIQQICQLLSCFYIKSHAHNREVEPALALIRQNLDYDDQFMEDQEKDWAGVVWWSHKTAICEELRPSVNPSKELLKGAVAHADIAAALKDSNFSSISCKDLELVNFQLTVKRVLRLTRLLALS